MLQKFAAFIFISILINACCASKSSSDQKDPKEDIRKYKNLAESKLGENCKITFNSDSTFFAAYASTKNSKLQSNSPLKFFIYDIQQEKILFEDNLPNGDIKWLNEHQLRVSTTPGIISGRDDKNNRRPGYVYDIKMKRKINPGMELEKNN